MRSSSELKAQLTVLADVSREAGGKGAQREQSALHRQMDKRLDELERRGDLAVSVRYRGASVLEPSAGALAEQRHQLYDLDTDSTATVPGARCLACPPRA